MLGRIALFIANRAADGAVGTVTRWASWGAVAALFGVSTLGFALIAVFLILAPIYGTVGAAALIAAGSLLAGLMCLAIPRALDAVERREAERVAAQSGVIATTVDAVQEETAAAVDYFGPLQVLASAFLVGMRTGQGVKARLPRRASRVDAATRI